MEIKFRGLRKEWKPEYGQSKWKIGNLLNPQTIGQVGSDLSHYEYCDVLPESVGQYIGIKDSEETDIFKGDILKLEWQTANHGKYFQSDDMWNEHEQIVVVDFIGLGFVFMANGKQFGKRKDASIKVIGNIFEHPHLIL